MLECEPHRRTPEAAASGPSGIGRAYRPTDVGRPAATIRSGTAATTPDNRQRFRVANVFYGIATSGGTLAYQKQAPTREAADKLLDGRLAAPFAVDANDTLYQWDASGDYNPSPGLELIEPALLAINSADDERNPPETGSWSVRSSA